MDIFKEFELRKINYAEIKGYSTFVLNDIREVDVSIIVPVYERVEFHKILVKHFKDAISISGKQISLTFVEHSEVPDHMSLCDDWMNYIFIPKEDEDEPFNKCLAHNIGALYSNKAKYYLFHDIDTIMHKDFFIKLFRNIRSNDALQSFTKQRLQYCNEEITKKLLSGQERLKNIMSDHADVSVGVEGAVGGSIFITSEMFFNTGGYSPEFFSEYSVEDQSFWDSISALGEIDSCNRPPIEMYHLYHENHHRVTKQKDWDAFNSFRALNFENRMCFIKERSEHLKQFRK